MRKPCCYIFLLLFCFSLFAFNSYAQQLKLGINPTQINPASVLELQSPNQGLLLTRVPDTNAINTFSPPAGMIIYFTDSNKITNINYGPNAGVYERKNGMWQRLLYAGDGSIGIVSLNGSTVAAQTFATGTSGTDFNISTNAATGVHTFNLPDASATVRGLVNTSTQTFGGAKTFANTLTLGKDLFTSGSPGSDGQVLRSSGAGISPRWENMFLDSLYNVKISSPSSGQILQYNGSSWVNAAGGSGLYWSLNGNGGTNPSNNFLGTTDYEPLVIKVNKQQVGYFGTTSGGSSNIAFGLSASAGYQSIAFGYNATNTGIQSVTLGYGATSNSDYTVTIGGESKVGTPTSTSANESIAIGRSTTASGFQSISVGSGASSTNNSAIAIGTGSTASGYQSSALGNGATASQQNSTAIGNGAIANVPNTLILGGIGPNVVNVGIGTSAPSNTLTVNSGTANTSGLTLTNLTSATSPTSGAAPIGVDNAGKVVTVNSGIISLNGLTNSTQTFATGKTGSDFNIASSSSTHTFNLPDASTSARGAVNTSTQTFGGNKIFNNNITVNGTTQVGTNGTPLTSITTATVNKDVGAIPGSGSLDVDFNIANAQVGATVLVSPGNPLPVNCSIGYAMVKSAGVVEVRFINNNQTTYSLGSVLGVLNLIPNQAQPIDPGAINYYFTLIK